MSFAEHSADEVDSFPMLHVDLDLCCTGKSRLLSLLQGAIPVVPVLAGKVGPAGSLMETALSGSLCHFVPSSSTLASLAGLLTSTQ